MRQIITIILLFAAGATQAETVTIDFDDLSLVSGSGLTSVTSKDFVFTAGQSGGVGVFNRYSEGKLVCNPAIGLNTEICDWITIEHALGIGFNLESLDLSALGAQNVQGSPVSCVPEAYSSPYEYSVFGCSLTVTGTLMTGGTVVLEANGFGQDSDFQFVSESPNFDTVSFPDTWTNLQTVTVAVYGNGYDIYDAGFSIDNVVVSTVVPVPAAAWLFGSGIITLGWFRRKKA
jgi:hypothetical protein